MGEVITFPGLHERSAWPIEVQRDATLTQKAEYFMRLRFQQITHESNQSIQPGARCRYDRTAQILETRIDRAVIRLQELPASTLEAQQNIRHLFALADTQPDARSVLEEAALYATSAYWNAGYVSTKEVAPVLRARACAAELRHDNIQLVRPYTIDVIHAVVTDYVMNPHVQRIDPVRLCQIEQHDLAQFFDHSGDDPDIFPPVA